MLSSSFKAALLSLGIGTLLLLGCQQQAITPAPAPDVPGARPLTGAEVSTVTSANDFAFRAFATLRRGAEHQNLCLSPLSLSAALTMTYNGADGTTKQAIRQTLGFGPQTDTEINDAYQGLFRRLTSLDPAVTFTTANSLWHGQPYQMQASFVQQNQTAFGATVRGLDFTSPTAKDELNRWVSTQTQGKITSIVDQTTPDDVLYLLNALYCKGTWTYRFDPQQTRPGLFRRDDGSTTTAEFMHLTQGRYLRYADARQQVIDLPYGNRQYSMTLVVPQGQTTLADVTRALSRAQLASWLAAADTTGLELRLPKFRLEYKRELQDVLTHLGMGVAFSSQANFSRMLAGGPINLAISNVTHKTFLEVNEEGTTAAAVTAVGIVTNSLPPVVAVDRPFVFLLREKSSNAILFIGQVTHP